MSVTIQTSGGSSVVGEKSTPTVRVSFTDENGNAVIPSAITWSLSDQNGNIINSREDVSFSSPASTINLTLTASDTTLQSTETVYANYPRFISFRAVYDSDLGSNLIAFEEGKFYIENFRSG